MTPVGPGTQLRAVDDGHGDNLWPALPRLVIGRAYTCEQIQENDLPTGCSMHTGVCTVLVTVREVRRHLALRAGMAPMQFAYCLKSFRPVDDDPDWMKELLAMIDRANSGDIRP